MTPCPRYPRGAVDDRLPAMLNIRFDVRFGCRLDIGMFVDHGLPWSKRRYPGIWGLRVRNDPMPPAILDT